MIISKFKDKLYIIGDYKLNIVNSQSLAFYQEDVDVPTLSLELNRGEIKSLMKNANGNAAMVVYGKPELMISEYCPIGSTFGGRSKDSGCNGICSKDKFKLIDRVNEELRVMTDLYCRSYILNPVPLNIIDEIEELKAVCGEHHLKVILETGALGSASNIKKASILSMYSGADFIKTSTGKENPAATPEAALVMCEAIKEYYMTTGRKVGFKPAGGINTVHDALVYYTIVKEVLGEEWLTNELFRLGTSRLANLLLSEIVGQETKFF